MKRFGFLHDRTCGRATISSIVVAHFVLLASLHAQVDTAWARRYNGPANWVDAAYALAANALGDVYVTGGSYDASGSNYDYTTIKYNADGVEQWVKRYNGPRSRADWANAIALDGSGNVYVTGASAGSGPGGDYATIKYDADGVQLWVARYNGPGNNNDSACAIAVDNAGNVYVTGYSHGDTTWQDYATVKYNSDGVKQWVARYDGTGNYQDVPTALAVDDSGNVYVTGWSNSGSWADYLTIKYDADGVEQWVARYDGPGHRSDASEDMAVDASGNVYVTGSSYGGNPARYDCATIKYDANGVQQWVARYVVPSGMGVGRDIALDRSGNVYVMLLDYTIIKLSSSGATVWVTKYTGPYTNYSYAMAIDSAASIYLTGRSYRGSSTRGDYATVKFNARGGQQWVAIYSGPGNDEDKAYAIAVDGRGNVYVTGESQGSGTESDFATIKYVPGGGIEEHDGEPADGVFVGSLRRVALDVRPNPSRTRVTFRYSPPEEGPVMLTVCDNSGRWIRTLVRKRHSRGTHSVTWDCCDDRGERVPVGVYFCTLRLSGMEVREKLLLLR